jgi:protein-S-isoprenylcysteine O-methyltransferase Ste14
MTTGSRHLGPVARIFWVLLTLVIGVFPSFLFFVWVERNMELPGARAFLGCPWISLWTESLSIRAVFDGFLFLAFGFFHSLLAQRPIQAAMRKVLPAQCIRAFYLCFSGISVTAMIGVWQPTGVTVWAIPGLSSSILSTISVLVYYPLLLIMFRTASLFDPLEFLGFRQLFSLPEQVDTMSSGGTLLDSGIYGRVRHPIYSFSLVAFGLAPWMTLDRLILFITAAIYLYFAIPVEERKLIARFGEAYRDYQKRVPAVLPRW